MDNKQIIEVLYFLADMCTHRDDCEGCILADKRYCCADERPEKWQTTIIENNLEVERWVKKSQPKH